MGNGDNTGQRPQPYYAQEIAIYVGILGGALGCVGLFGGMWAALAGWCEWWMPPLIGGTVAAIGLVFAARWLISNRIELLWAAERIVGDLDGDGIVGKPKSRYPAMPAPSGNDVLLKDLGAFAKLAPDDKVGTSFQGFWSERWAHPYWQDVMDIWAAHRCVEPRKQRHKSKWLAKSYEEAIVRLFGTYANRPTP